MVRTGATLQIALTRVMSWKVPLALLKLTKPWVTTMLTMTAVMTAWIASGPWVSFARIAILAIAGALMSGGAASLNQYFESDLDARMPRTSGRPLPAGILPRSAALWWGTALCTTSLIVALAWLPLESTSFIVAGLIIYVPLYTLALKRRTMANVVLGGAAGACPVLAGWAVARADWPITPFALAALVFFWTPAHFWAYAMVHKEGYKKTRIPMLPTQIGARMTVPHIAAHVVLMTVSSLLAVQGIALIITLIGNGLFVILCYWLWKEPSGSNAWKFYKFSNYYLIAVFSSMALGGALGL